MAFHAAIAGAPVRVSSASIELEQREFHPLIVEILGERGIELRRTVSQPLSDELVAQADLILTMTVEHVMAIVGQFADAKPKVFLVDHFGQIVMPQTKSQPFERWVDVVYEQERDYASGHDFVEIADPIGQDESVFRSVALKIDELTGWIATVLASVEINSSESV